MVTWVPMYTFLLFLPAVLWVPILPLNFERSQGNASKTICLVGTLRTLLYLSIIPWLRHALSKKITKHLILKWSDWTKLQTNVFINLYKVNSQFFWHFLYTPVRSTWNAVKKFPYIYIIKVYNIHRAIFSLVFSLLWSISLYSTENQRLCGDFWDTVWFCFYIFPLVVAGVQIAGAVGRRWEVR